MVLPSGFVYDRQYLALYTDLDRLGLLTYVDSIVNCDDLLFNFLVANHTGAGPVVVNFFARALPMGISGGLWTRGIHMTARDHCLDKFAQAFGGMPLRYFGLRAGVSRHNELKRSKGLHEVPRASDLWWSSEPLPLRERN
jgi:hypothetical protein